MVTYTAALFTAAAPVAAPRSGGGALSEAECPAQPAGNAPDGGAKKIEREFTVG